MGPYKLTMSQREVLEALIRLYDERRRLIKSKEIAELVNKDEGTVRNIILSLKSLGLVESKTGPTGGYMPTLKAYEIIRGIPVQLPVKLKKAGKELDIPVTTIEILDMLNPEGCRAILRVQGRIRGEINVGDKVEIGPTKIANVRIEGEVTHIDLATKQIGIKITRLISVPRIPVGEIASIGNIITIEPDATIKDAAKLMIERRVKGLPVIDSRGRLIGIITQTDIAKAVAEGRIDATVKEYMSFPVITIRSDEDIGDAIELMNLRDIGRLVVTDSEGKPIGIITRTDILKFIAGLR
ncbi:CBS domain-containing protein [Hyperthermus butylicus]|uniref:Transcriptional regulator n=1 Tax=Hyperthermus butylicus (strain DSM 5456 / JCM 9403 / PLM1-5) TaxID=415426 RepID=A2BJ31_HYPBU|nr:CBS domain-containing protein [Hyperthermus butylicus]ABM79992.1 putative transcriptional regulator [Hyperthermus butylicus DSM 5456]